MMRYRVKILRILKSEETEVGKGAIVILPSASVPLIKFLREKYSEERTCMIGDISFLFTFDGVGLEKNDRLYKA